MTIETWAEQLAIRLKKANDKETASVPVLTYALIIVINFAIPVICSLTIGSLTRSLPGTLLSIIAFTAIRAVSGGFHFKSAVVCILITTLITATPPHIPLPNTWLVPLTIASVLIFAMFAPANIKGYARMPEKYFPLLKVCSIAMVCANLALQSKIVAIVFLIQALLLLPFPNKEV